MTRHRARLVCEKALFSAAVALGVPDCLRLGNGEEATGGRAKPSIVSDALEAILGAVYLDGVWSTRGGDRRRGDPPSEDARVDETDGTIRHGCRNTCRKGISASLRTRARMRPAPNIASASRSVRRFRRGHRRGRGRDQRSAGQEAARDALTRLGLLEDEPCG